MAISGSPALTKCVHLFEQLLARVAGPAHGMQAPHRAFRLELQHIELVTTSALNSASDSCRSCWRATFNASAQRWSNIALGTDDAAARG